MENANEIIKERLDAQLNDSAKIRMADSTTFDYPFTLTTEQAAALGLSPDTPRADITLDLMMEFMNVYGLDEQGNPAGRGTYPDEVKGPFIRRIFELYGQKIRDSEGNSSAPSAESADEETLDLFFRSESQKQVRRFYLNYPAFDHEGKELHLYIETEVDEDDASYLNYWVGCEEYTAKRYIASCQADLNQENPLAIVKVKHLYAFLDEVLKQHKEHV